MKISNRFASCIVLTFVALAAVAGCEKSGSSSSKPNEQPAQPNNSDSGDNKKPDGGGNQPVNADPLIGVWLFWNGTAFDSTNKISIAKTDMPGSDYTVTIQVNTQSSNGSYEGQCTKGFHANSINCPYAAQIQYNSANDSISASGSVIGFGTTINYFRQGSNPPK